MNDIPYATNPSSFSTMTFGCLSFGFSSFFMDFYPYE